ncbi:MAG: iron transporter [Psychrobium sp.]|nr:iron transporter [Psychrobium sp.]
MRSFTHQQLSLTARCLAAIVGAYCFALASSFGMVPILINMFDSLKADAVYFATLYSYIFGFIAIIYVFCRRKAWLAWRDIIIGCTSFMTIHFVGAIG